MCRLKNNNLPMANTALYKRQIDLRQSGPVLNCALKLAARSAATNLKLATINPQCWRRGWGLGRERDNASEE